MVEAKKEDFWLKLKTTYFHLNDNSVQLNLKMNQAASHNSTCVFFMDYDEVKSIFFRGYTLQI